MNKSTEGPRSILNMLALIVAFLAALISFFGATFTYLSQAQIAAEPLWPLPGLVLLDWILAGSLGFIAAYFSRKKLSRRWLFVTWLVTGSFIPLIILGAFSIGFMVFITFGLNVLSTAILAFRYQTSWLANFGLLMVGSLGNLGLLMLIIALSGPTL